MIGIGTVSPQHQVSIVGATPIFNMTDSDINLDRSSAAEASDSSAITLDASGGAFITAKNAVGATVFQVGSTGILTYNFIHWVGSADVITYTPSITQNLYTKLTPAMVEHENDGMTYAADSLTVISAGDYTIDISVRFSGANANDAWQIKVYKNHIAMASSVGRFIIRTNTAGLPDTRSYFWYLQDLAADDDISFRMTNLTASRDPTFLDFKIYMEKKPE